MPKGAVRQVGRLVCGLVMLAAILSPVARLDAAEGRRWLAGYFASVEQRRAGLEETVNNQMKHIIEGEYAAYIVDKAAELGLTCTAQVECQRSAEGLYLPVRTEVTGMLTEDIRIQLVRTIAEDLGVPERAQVYYTK
jgi:stage III sporulation protein AF